MFPKQNAFGASSSTTGFGTFGNTNNTSPFAQSFNKPAAAFGQQSAFGTQNTGLFGSPQTSTGIFNTGTTNTFGSTGTTQPSFGGFSQPQTSNTLFGTPQQNTQPTLFGQNTTPAFGAQQTKPAFGFNQTQPNNSIFGQTTAASSTFGSFGTQQQNTSVFGSAGTAFGQTNQTANAGTSVAKYQPSIGTDTLIKNGQPNNVSTKQHCLTAMKEYENKSIEELRYEDYLANRKGNQGNPNMFGQPSSSTGLFGTNTQQPTGLFGQQTDNKSVFNTTNQIGTGTAFGQNTAGTAFGQNNQNSGGLFSKSFTTPATNTNNAFGGFGSTDPNNAFGAKPAFNQPQGTNLFGQNTIQTSTAFGQTPSFNTFGTGNTQPSLFGNTSTDNKGAFGLPSATSNSGFSAFGNNPTTASGPGLFGKPAGFGTNTGFSNQTSTSAFGTNTFGTNPNTSLFNSGGLNKPPVSGFGNFGTSQPNTALGGGLNTGAQGQNNLFSNSKPGGLFGNNTLNAGSMFGNNPLMNNLNTLPTFNSGLNNTSSFMGGQTQQQTVAPVHQQILAMSSLPYGDNQMIKEMKLSNTYDSDVLKPTNPAAQKAILETSMNYFKVQSKFSAGIKTKSISDNLTKKSLFDGLESFDNSLADNFKLKSNAKRLIIKPKVDSNHSTMSDSNNKENLESSGNNISIAKNDIENVQTEKPNLIYKENKRNSTTRESWLNSNILDNSSQQIQKSLSKSDLNETIDNSSLLVGDEESSSVTDKTRNIDLKSPNEEKPTNAAGVVLNRVGYYMIPPTEELDSYIDEDGNCIVPSLTIGRERYGNVFFNQPINITNMNFDEIVHIRYKQITIYPDDDSKPPEGEGLNREAQVTLDQVWPVDKTLHEPIKDVDRLSEMNYEGKLRNVCCKQNMRFLEYNPETGSWVFKVKHFSKYGLTDSDEEDDSVPDIKKIKTSKDNEKTKVVIVPAKTSEINLDETIEKSTKKAVATENGLVLNNQNWNMSYNNSPKEPIADAHKLQLMKASFFISQNIETESIMSEKSNESFDQMVPTRANAEDSLPNKSYQEIDYFQSNKKLHEILIKKDKDDYEENELPFKQEDLCVKPSIAPCKVNTSEIFLPSSIISNETEKCLADTALVTGYRFKVSFNALNSFFTPASCNQSLNKISGNERKKNHSSVRFIECYEVNYNKSKLEDKYVIQHLNVYLDHAVRQEVDSSECPHLKCGGDLELLQLHCNVSNNKNEFKKIWSLCLALWGMHEELEGYDQGCHHVNVSRRNLLSKWFEEEMQNKKLKSGFDNLKRADTILEKLLSHQVNEAASLAFENDEPFQALLISQISSGIDVRQLIQHQLATWEQFEIDEHIDTNILKIFMLLSGTQVMSTKNGTIDVLEDQSWLNVLAVHLWYLLTPTSSITDVVNTYDRIFRSDEFLVVQPHPDHFNLGLHSHIRDIFDLKYHILQLYSKRNYSVENIVNPLIYTSDILDYSISWLILQMLEVIGYKHCSEMNQEKLHLSFAAQLENCGQWIWAVFVQLHINNRDKREMSIQEILYRNIELNTDKKYTDDEKFVINRLGIPEKWINWAKALRAGIQRNFKLQTDLYLKSDQWNSAYKILIKHVVPDAIINENFNYIRECLSKIENKFKIPNWSNEGHIILSFIDICTKLSPSQLIHKKDMKQKWNSLNPKICEVCSRLNHFPCPTSKHKLCQSEMAQKLTCLIRTYLLAWQDGSANTVLKMTLGMLPLPQEFLQQELRFLFSNIAASNA